MNQQGRGAALLLVYCCEARSEKRGRTDIPAHGSAGGTHSVNRLVKIFVSQLQAVDENKLYKYLIILNYLIYAELVGQGKRRRIQA